MLAGLLLIHVCGVAWTLCRANVCTRRGAGVLCATASAQIDKLFVFCLAMILHDSTQTRHPFCLSSTFRYLADIVAELRHPRVAKEGTQTRLLFKKRMFRWGPD